MDHLPPLNNVTWNIRGQDLDRTFFVLCACTKHALNVTIEFSCCVMIDHTVSIHCLVSFFSLFYQQELKYRHEVVSVEQINKKIGIQ